MSIENDHEIDLEATLEVLLWWNRMHASEKRTAIRKMDWARRTRRNRLPRSRTITDVSAGTFCALLGLFLLLISIVYLQDTNTTLLTLFILTTPLMIPLVLGVYNLLHRR
jgi:hypothetical protein